MQNGKIAACFFKSQYIGCGVNVLKHIREKFPRKESISGDGGLIIVELFAPEYSDSILVPGCQDDVETLFRIARGQK